MSGVILGDKTKDSNLGTLLSKRGNQCFCLIMTLTLGGCVEYFSGLGTGLQVSSEHGGPWDVFQKLGDRCEMQTWFK